MAQNERGANGQHQSAEETHARIAREHAEAAMRMHMSLIAGHGLDPRHLQHLQQHQQRVRQPTEVTRFV